MFKVVSKKTGEIRTVYMVRDNGPLLQFLIFDDGNYRWVWGLASDFVPCGFNDENYLIKEKTIMESSKEDKSDGK